MRAIFKFGLVVVFVLLIFSIDLSSGFAEGIRKAELLRHSIQRGEVGAAWFEDYFGALYAIESIRIIPPDKDFKGLNHKLHLKILNSDDRWVTIISLPVNPDDALNEKNWQKISLAPKLTPELEAVYKAMKKPPPSTDTYGYRLEAIFQPQIPTLVQGIRFEMVGSYLMGKAWTFWIKTDSFPARHGGLLREWRYTHVW